MTRLEFWQAVYVAAVRAGGAHVYACAVADKAEAAYLAKMDAHGVVDLSAAYTANVDADPDR